MVEQPGGDSVNSQNYNHFSHGQAPNAGNHFGFEMTSQTTERPRASFLGLPSELREQIYDKVFHPPTHSERASERLDFDDRHSDCRCGEGLLIVSKQVYLETRSRFYNCATFVFSTPMACKAFLGGIGHHSTEVGSLDITYTNNIQESSLLQEIFETLRASTKLTHLLLRIAAGAGEPSRDMPMYIPRLSTSTYGTIRDNELRPIHHPLANLKALKRLTVLGNPGDREIEEVLYKASKNVEKLALSLGLRPYMTAIWAPGASSNSFTVEARSHDYEPVASPWNWDLESDSEYGSP